MGQPPIPPTPEGTTLAGKTVIVTGGNTGLGFEAARQFLTLMASRVIITARSTAKGDSAVEALRSDPEVQSLNPNARIEAFDLALDDYKSVLNFVHNVKNEVKELDVLLQNAGVNFMKYQASKDGHEKVMQVNCYSAFFISLELLDLLQSTAVAKGTASHLTFVGSATQKWTTVSKKPVDEKEKIITYFDDKEIYNGMARYSDSKLVVNAFVQAFAAKVPSSQVIINNLCPGMVTTGLDRDLPLWLKSIMYIVRKARARDVTEGARTLIFATAVADEKTHGKFMQHNQVDPGAPFLGEPIGRQFTEKFWVEMLEEARKINPELDQKRFPW